MKLKNILITGAALMLLGAGCANAPVNETTDPKAKVKAPTTSDAKEGLELDPTTELEVKNDEVVGDESDAAMEAREVTIIYTGSKFDPANITIKKGVTVTFLNNSNRDIWPASSIHPVHNILPGFDLLRGMQTGETYSFTFDQTGKWGYHDHLRASQGGVITVTN